MNITALALRRPVTTLMLFFCFVMIGIIGARKIPLEYFPEVQFPGLFINAPYRGSSAEEVERLVTRPIEAALATVSGIRRMTSTTNNEAATIFIQFDWDTPAIVKGIEAREKIDAIRQQLPRDLERVFVFSGRTTDQPIMEIRISSDTRDLSKAYDLLERKLRRPIEQIAGISKVELQGVEPLQIEIQLRAERVAAHGISLNQLAAQLSKENFSVSAGQITDSEQRLRVKPVGEWRSAEDIARLPINGQGLRLGDIADVRYEQALREVGRHINLKDAIGLSIQKEAGANMVDVATKVMAKVHSISASKDFEGIQLFMLNNQAEGVVNSLRDIVSSGAVGFVLSILVLYAFMRNWALTLVVALAVPFSLAITLAYMYFAQVTINVLSMMGLMLAIGMLVDNAVVVSEAIYRHEQSDLHSDARRAKQAVIIAGAKQVGLAITTGTITTVIVFLPNIIGEKIDITVFLSHVATTITVSLFASLFIALTIIPLLLARLPRVSTDTHIVWLERLTNFYERCLRWTIAHPRWSTLCAVLILASAAIPAYFVKQEMFEANANDRMVFNHNIEGNYTVDKVEAAITPIEKWLIANRERLDIDTVYSYFTTNESGTFVLLNKKRKTELGNQDIADIIEKEAPKLAIGRSSFKRDRFGGAEDLRIQLSGESTERLIALAQELSVQLRSVKGLRDVRSEAGRGDMEVQVRIDRIRAQALGLTPEGIASTIAVAMRGQRLRTLRDSEAETQVMLMFSRHQRQHLSDLETLPLFRNAGRRSDGSEKSEQVPLHAVADITVRPAMNEIRREERMTTIAVTASPNEISAADARKLIEPLIGKLQMPPGYRVDFGGGFDREDEANRVFAQNMLLALMMIYVVMAMLFESLLFPSAVIFSIFYAVVGVFWTFFILNTSLSVMAYIGILVLMGVIVNNGIVLIDHINQARRNGMDRQSAIIDAGRERLRPILMTTATTVLGLLPLCMGSTTIGGDNDSPPYYPMARAVAGGLTFSTIVSLLILPTIYIGLDNLRIWNTKVWQAAKTNVAAAPTATPNKLTDVAK